MAKQNAYQRRYSLVEARWPEEVPTLTEKEAITAARRLWRKEMGRPFKGEIRMTSGRRYSWERDGVLYLNPGRGWRELVHDLSHYFHWRLRPNDRPHSSSHTMMEIRMAEHVVNSGWLEGKLKPKPAAQRTTKRKPTELDRVRARIKAWETKKKRAETYLKKLETKRKRLERAAAKKAA